MPHAPGPWTPDVPQCQALVLVPTRELAQQVGPRGRDAGGRPGLRGHFRVRRRGLRRAVGTPSKKGAHLVVGTPGPRPWTHLMRGTLSLDNLRMLVMDEARPPCCPIGFYPDMKQVPDLSARNAGCTRS